MSIAFHRTDITQTSQAERGTMCVLPLSKGKRQNKIVLGDCDGVIQALGMRKKEEERNSVFKTNPGPNPITCLTLGATAEQGDKIFASSGNEVRGVNRKGKEFFKFTTNLTETIRNIHVEGVSIFAAGEYVANQYEDCADAHFFMSNDRVNDMSVAPVILPTELNPVLACRDRFVRVVQGSELYYEASVSGAATVAETCDENNRRRAASGEEHAGRTEVIWGTEQGGVGQLFLDGEQVIRGWVIDGGRGGGGAVTAVCAECDLTGDGVNDVVVGRENGALEVYSLDENGEPTRVAEKALNESVQTLRHGKVSSPFDEILAHTFSGKVLAFRPGADSTGVDGFAVGEQLDDHQVAARRFASANRMNVLKVETQKLEQEVEAARNEYAKASGDLIAAGAPARVLDSFRLDPATGCHELALEAPSAIFAVSVQSDVPVDLIDARDVSVMCARSTPEPGSGAAALATYRPTEPASRVTVTLRAIEGQAGKLRAFVVPERSPKTCAERVYDIKPLCLHVRTAGVEEGDRPMNRLRVSGAFSLDDAHHWVGECLGETPSKTPTGRDEVSYDFEHALLGTVLRVTVREGEAIFVSDSATPLALLKEHVSREATSRRTQVRFAFDAAEGTPRRFCERVHPLLEYQRDLVGQERLLEGLREIKMQEPDLSFLSDEYKKILEDEARVAAEVKDQPRRLEYLHGIVKDFFVDWHKFKGKSVKHAMGAVDEVLEDYTLERLVEVVERGG